MSQKNRAAVGTGLALAIYGSVALAQTTPGAVGDSVKPAPQVPQAPAPLIQGPAKAPKKAMSVTAKLVNVQAFEFSGNTRFNNEQLRAITREYEGQDLTLFDIFDVADKVADFYVSQGYTLASVNVPPQKIESGVVRMEVTEGTVGKITVEGNKQYKSESVTSYLSDVKPGTLYRGSALTEGLNVLNELPGLRTRAVLRPSGAPGVNDISVIAVEDPYDLFFSVDNHGRESIGEVRFSAGGALNNPLRIGDQLQLMGLVSEDALLKYGFISYSLPLNHLGTRLMASYGHAEFELDDKIVDGVEGENKTARIELSHSFIRTQSDRLTLTVGGSNTRANADLFGLRLPGDTDLTLFELGGNLLHIWNNSAATMITLGASSNFADSNPNQLAKPNGRDRQLFRGEAEILHLQPLPAKLQLLLRGAGSYSPEALPDTQQFSLGGPSSVRGYPSSEVRGDAGIFGSITLRRPFQIGPVLAMASIFGDAGRVERYDLPDGVDSFDELSSVGAGLDLRYRMISAKFEGAAPLDDRDVSDGDDDFRFFASAAVSF